MEEVKRDSLKGKRIFGAGVFAGAQTQDYDRWEMKFTFLPEHPFGLEILPEYKRRTDLIHFPNAGPGSREDMIVFARLFKRLYRQTLRAVPIIRYMRIIKAREDSVNKNKFDWYFEMGLEENILFGGGWPDYCPQYGLGAMQDLFEFISYTWEVQVETVEKDFHSSRKAEDFLFPAYNYGY